MTKWSCPCKIAVLALFVLSLPYCSPSQNSRVAEGQAKGMLSAEKGVKTVNTIKVTVAQVPEKTIVAHFSKSGTSGQSKYDGKYYFVLSFSIKNKEMLKQLPFQKYSELVQTMSFRMPEYIDILLSNGERVTPSDCLFQQTYGAGPANQVLVVFEKEKLKGETDISMDLKEFGLGIGNLSYPLVVD